ncbi:MAG TPA: DUF4389 domain-containing protein [Actinomycetota bacterium]|nr:DUF4389 domain-containing protein [Actinomycetota bacterium]
METRLESYPVQLSVDYPEVPRRRLTVLFRLVLAIPILIVLSALANELFISLGGGDSADTARFTVGAGGVLFLPTLLMLVFRRKYPGWWFDWNVNLLRFENRILAYLLLLRDEYPSTDAEQSVHVVLPEPDGGGSLNRWMPLVKWLLVIPHLIVLVILTVVAVVLTLIAWVAIVITGRHPRGIYDFVVGTLRWWLRVEAYGFVLVTDRYPPFRLAP